MRAASTSSSTQTLMYSASLTAAGAAAGRLGAFVHALAAPGHLLGRAPVEGGAVRDLAGEPDHLRAEGAEVDGRRRRRGDV